MPAPMQTVLVGLGWCWIATVNPAVALLVLFWCYLTWWSRRSAAKGR